jgi:CubicO group peptidase (beta-lactamase class C family)
MLLKEQGKLTYLDPVKKFIPDFPYEEVNIHMLLSHRSGLPNYVYFCDHLCDDRSTPLSNNDVISLMSNRKPEPYAKPDKRFQYCNTNYCVLATIIEKASGMSFREFLHKYLFDPSGMKNTELFSMMDTIKIDNAVKGHFANGRAMEYNYLNGVVGDKGVYSTVTDLFKWDNALFAGKIISKETLEDGLRPTSEIKRNGASYGLWLWLAIKIP